MKEISALSFGNSSSHRGTYDRKNVKRKKQNFHTRKIRLNAESEVPADLAALKNKVIVSLAHLGEQKFSAEPGGYSFENWMKSFNMLLDDFETKAGSTKLPKEYYTKRLDLTASLVASIRDGRGDLTQKISELRDEEQSLTRAIALSGAKSRSDHEKSERDQKIRELEADVANGEEQLVELRKRLDLRRKQSSESRGVFRRFVSGLSKPADATPIEVLESRVAEKEEVVQSDKRKISELKLRNEKSEVHLDDKLSNKSREELESGLAEVVSEIEKLESNLEEQQQLSEQRKEVTKTLSGEIAKINFSETVATAPTGAVMEK